MPSSVQFYWESLGVFNSIFWILQIYSEQFDFFHINFFFYPILVWYLFPFSLLPILVRYNCSCLFPTLVINLTDRPTLVGYKVITSLLMTLFCGLVISSDKNISFVPSPDRPILVRYLLPMARFPILERKFFFLIPPSSMRVFCSSNVRKLR